MNQMLHLVHFWGNLASDKKTSKTKWRFAVTSWMAI